MTVSLLRYKRVHPATSRNLNIRLQVTMETLKQWVCMFLSKHFGCHGHMATPQPQRLCMCWIKTYIAEFLVSLYVGYSLPMTSGSQAQKS